MKVTSLNALSFFASMDQAQRQLSYLGDMGEPYIDRLRAIRGTFTPDDIQQSFFDQIEAVVTALAELTEVDMAQVTRPAEIEFRTPRLLPEVALAIGYINEAVNWLRDHAE